MAKAIAKTAAIAVAAGLTFAGSAGIATDAFAQETSTTDAAAQPTVATAAPAADLIGTDQVSLTIHKRVNPTELRKANGEVDNGVSGTPLKGVGFTATKINGDITDQKIFNEIAKLANAQDIASAKKRGLGDKTELGVTGDNGATNAKKLPVGAYLIEETSTPAPAKGEKAAYVKSDPFIVFLPMTSSDGKSWNRDVHVYPKNSMATVKKSVQDDKKNAEVEGRKGEKKVTYTLDGVVPATPENHTFDEFKLNDSYNNKELRLDDGYLKSVVVKRGDKVVETLVQGTDYTVNKGESTAATDSQGKDYNAGFVIALTETGRGKVQVNDHVVATVEATLLNNNTVTGQDVWNDVFASGTFTRVPGTGEGFEPKEWETPHDEVVTYLGKIEVYKTGDTDGDKKALAGAKFDLYRCNDADNVIQSGTTDDKGLLSFEGLHVTNFRDNEDAPKDEIYEYCIKETKAPAGYSKDPEEHRITLTKDDRNSRNDKGVYVKNEAEDALRMNGVSVNNIKSSVPTLPSTGGMGVLIIVLAGLAIIGGGVYAARRNSQAA